MPKFQIKKPLKFLFLLVPQDMKFKDHYYYVIMSVMASKITSVFVQVQIKENIKAPRHWPPMDSHHKKPVLQKMFPFDDVIHNGCHFAEDIFKYILLDETLCILILTDSLFLRVQLTISHNLGNGLAPQRWQAITWTNDERSSYYFVMLNHIANIFQPLVMPPLLSSQHIFYWN